MISLSFFFPLSFFCSLHSFREVATRRVWAFISFDAMLCLCVWLFRSRQQQRINRFLDKHFEKLMEAEYNDEEDDPQVCIQSFTLFWAIVVECVSVCCAYTCVYTCVCM